MKLSFYDYCMQNGQEDKIESWIVEKNAPVGPKDVPFGSRFVAWWKCERGHEWQVAVYARKAGHGCPYCVRRIVLSGFNDLATLYPEVAKYWHPTKNGSLKPDQVMAKSHRKVWWKCERGHEWQSMPKVCTTGSGCPICANRLIEAGQNDLATLRPALAEEWNVERNRISPQDVSIGTRQKVWWRCKKGHEWRAGVSSRVRGAGCPVCANRVIIPGDNDLKTNFPMVAKEWHPTKNGALEPEHVAPMSNQKVWWLCLEGHDYQAMVSHRVSKGSTCPYCVGRKVWRGFNDLATLEPLVAESWHKTLNGTLTPEAVTIGSSRRVWWECPDGHVWQTTIYSRTRQHTGCPVCAGRVKPSRNVRAVVTDVEHHQMYGG